VTDWTLAIQIEHEIARIITEQEIAGWQFDVDLAHKHLEFLHGERERLYQEVRPSLSKEVRNVGPVSRPFKMDGSPSAHAAKYYGTDPDCAVLSDQVSGPFSRVEFVEPDMGSRKKLIAQLSRIGWRPDEYTNPSKTFPQGQPKLTESSLEALSSGLGRDVALWYMYGHRESLIASQLLPEVRSDGRIPAVAFPCGTNTGRMRHKIVVNIPKAVKQVIFGRECRELFIARPGYKLVGWDAKQLELRMLAHLINDPEYTEVIINGDPHALHQELAGLPTKDDAKTFLYAFVYGGGDSKLGEISGTGRAGGQRLRARFLKRIPNLEAVIERVKGEARGGFVEGVDGRRLWMRRSDGEIALHRALNTKLQGNGAIVCKATTIFIDRAIRREGLDATKVGDFHDEGQYEVREDHIEKFMELPAESIVKSGNLLNINVPLGADVKSGNNWAETH
jgi:DNA polymerase I-like protein with 3'-5' exonuclease and polymerase domains